jgi:RAD50-interacting protein 1
VDLWDELQRRAKKTDVDDNLAGPISYTDVRNSTSLSVGSDEDGALFDETITAFRKRRDHAEILVIEAIQYAFPSSLSPYINKPQWLTVDDDSDSG